MNVNKVAINGQELPPYHAQVVQDALNELHARLTVDDQKSLHESLGVSKDADAERKKRLTALGQIHTLFQ